MPAFNKITAKQFNATLQIKHVRMTPKMYRMCLDSNIAAFELYRKG